MNGQIIPFTPKNYKKNDSNQKNTQEKKDLKTNQEKEEEDRNKDNKESKENKEKQPKTTPMFIPSMTPIPNSIFFNQVQANKNYYNKFQGKKLKYFKERTGDWICNNCMNLNFAFRVVCNRCKLPKPNDPEKKEENDDKNNNSKNTEMNNRYRFQNKGKYKYKKNYQYYNDKNSNCDKNGEDK